MNISHKIKAAQTISGFLTSFLLVFLCHNPSIAKVEKGIDWRSFMSRNDMVFDTLTTTWEEGVFTGNGLLGAMIYLKDGNTLRMDIGRSDVSDRRPGYGLFFKARLPIGHFLIKPRGKIKKINARMDLWNAEIRGTIVTDKGTISFRQLTFSQTDIIYLQANYTGEERGFTWQFVPEASISPATKYEKAPANYVGNPDGNASSKDGIDLFYQPLLIGGGYATAWLSRQHKNSRELMVTVANSTKNNESIDQAFRQVSDFETKKVKAEVNKHRKWWHTYYQQSFMSIPDARMENFYWIQQYKLASATREGKPALDLMGPWFRSTPWPAYWFNLNIQLTYSSLYTANRLNTASTLINMVDKASQNLVNNVLEPYRQNSAGVARAGGPDMVAVLYLKDGGHPFVNNGSAELGNLTWILYYYWNQYRYSMDKNLAVKLYPLLKRSINLYIHFLKKNTDGKYALTVKTYSPEYEKGYAFNTNYDLSLLRWGCQTLLELNKELKENDPLEDKWKDILANLIPYPQDKTGYMIASDVPMTSSHRHYSHLLMIYPLHLVNWDQPENREVILKSLEHWHSFPKALYGYSFTGGGSIYATMGKGNQTRDYLNQLLKKFVKPNTMYMESGPVIETPLAACQTLQEMYLQYWNHTLRIFPAVPDDWKDCSFQNFRTEGAFLVSAVRKDMATKWIKLESLHGGEIIIKPGFDLPLKLKSKQNIKIQNKGNGIYSLNMPKGSSVYLYTAQKDLEVPLGVVNDAGGLSNIFGKKTK